MGHLRRQLALVFAATVVAQAPAYAQSPGVATDRAAVVAGIEADRDRLTWRFENPSSFDTAALVPHFFEQSYVADNVWLTAAARYTAGLRWETTAGVSPSRSAAATDYDTFFDPDGSVVVSGTGGEAAIRGVRASQMAAVGRIGAAALVVGYRFRLDTADFGIGHRTVIRNGALVEAGDVTTREATSSQQHELVMGITLPIASAGSWTLAARGEFAPAIFGRLVVRLPDKYPGADLVFLAKVAGTAGRLTLARTGTEWPVAVTVDVSRTWSYRSDARLTRSIAGLGITIGRSW